MTYTPITTNIHQSLDVELHFTSKLAFYAIFCSDNLANLTSLFIRPILYFRIKVDTGFL